MGQHRKIEKHLSCTRSRVLPWTKLPPLRIAIARRSSSPLHGPATNCATASLPLIHSRENYYKQLPYVNEVLMITREDLRQIADFESRENEFAISFYFQPGVPKDKSHREEGIQVKELVRKTIQDLQQNGRSSKAIQDLER